MVAKISSGSSIFGALAYNQTKVEELQAKVILTSRMMEPRDGNYTVGVCMRSFEPYLDANQKTYFAYIIKSRSERCFDG
jgi:hypothetical protein